MVYTIGKACCSFFSFSCYRWQDMVKFCVTTSSWNSTRGLSSPSPRFCKITSLAVRNVVCCFKPLWELILLPGHIINGPQVLCLIFGSRWQQFLHGLHNCLWNFPLWPSSRNSQEFKFFSRPLNLDSIYSPSSLLHVLYQKIKINSVLVLGGNLEMYTD